MSSLARTFLCALALVCAAHNAHADSARRHLIWSDEFDGKALDRRCWTPELTRPGNNWDEVQRFTAAPKNLYVKAGSLVIAAHKEITGEGEGLRRYTSAQITTVDNAYWTYGYYEARIRAPKGAGTFPAFWMMPQHNEWGGWPNSGEIDIWEYIGRDPNIVYTALHFKGDDWHGGVLTMPQPLYDTYHVYALEWLPHRFRWFVDGKLMWEKTSWISPDPARARAPFDTPFYLILNQSLGGTWPHPVPSDARFPMDVSVDYVRVYSIDGVKDPRPRPPTDPNDAHACPRHGPSGAKQTPVNLRVPVVQRSHPPL